MKLQYSFIPNNLSVTNIMSHASNLKYRPEVTFAANNLITKNKKENYSRLHKHGVKIHFYIP